MAVAGRYYFADDDVPAYAGWHNVGSRNWHDTNWTIESPLGEVLTAPQRWDNGAPPAILPLITPIGGVDCIERGASPPALLGPCDLIDGFPPDCHHPGALLDHLWERVSSYNSCGTQRLYLWLLTHIALENDLEIHDMIDLFVPAPHTTRVFAGTDTMPAFACVITTRWSLVIIQGTETNTQLAMQVVSSFSPGVNIGIGSTMPLWYQASTYVSEKLAEEGALANRPIMIVGYSYGGAVAHLLSARYRHASPTRPIRFLTFASPKPGDARLVNLMRECEGISIANDNDIVPSCPPDRGTIAPFAGFLLYPLLLLWDNWERPPNQARLDADGTLHPNGVSTLDYHTIVRILENIVQAESLDVTHEHRLPQYIARFQRRCPMPLWPTCSALDILDYYWGPTNYSVGLGRWQNVAQPNLVLTGSAVIEEPAEGALVLVGSTEPIGECDLCSAPANTYSTTFTDLGNVNCNACTFLNGYNIVLSQVSNCVWTHAYPFFFDCPFLGAQLSFFLRRTETGCEFGIYTTTLNAPQWIMATYESTDTEWTCGTAITLARITPVDSGPDQQDFCENWPDEITVTPGSGGGGGGGCEVSVSVDDTDVEIDAATVEISGTGFSETPSENTVTFNLGAAGTVTASTTTSLTVTFDTQPTATGSLTAVVAVDGCEEDSGAPVQVATIFEIVENTCETAIDVELGGGNYEVPTTTGSETWLKYTGTEEEGLIGVIWGIDAGDPPVSGTEIELYGGTCEELELVFTLTDESFCATPFLASDDIYIKVLGAGETVVLVTITTGC